MPHASRIVHALPSIRDERTHLAHVQLACRGDNHQIRRRLQRDERLTAQRVTLQHLHLVRQLPRLASEDVHQRPPTLRAQIHRRQIMESLGRPAIDREMLRTLQLDHIAEWRERLPRQSLDLQCRSHHVTLLVLSVRFALRLLNNYAFLSLNRPHRRRRDTPPSGMMLKRMCVIAPNFCTCSSK
ncbi:hypothetical protein PSP31121_05696 [Pandoraea sputorum]|uniref:Uncharacterized protein n=1 Tax=Pandoraea sputorum TaxID=93222 RepID=A0A5E5BL70_9BURK|nr:hypothetical protein PSP31121_05696 [Pandoraea sputorum]